MADPENPVPSRPDEPDDGVAGASERDSGTEDISGVGIGDERIKSGQESGETELPAEGEAT